MRENSAAELSLMFYSATLIPAANFLKHSMHQHDSSLQCLIMTLLIIPAHICILSSQCYIRSDTDCHILNLIIIILNLTLTKLEKMVSLKFNLQYKMPAKLKVM